MVILATLIVTVLNSLLYRFGGCSLEEGKQKYPWAPEWMFRSWVRDWLIPFPIIIWLLLFYRPVPWFIYVGSILPMGGALSTYWDWLR